MRDYQLVRGTAPLPPGSTRGDILAVADEVLRNSGIQSLTITIDKPIAYSRLVPRGEDNELALAFTTTVDIFGVLRNLPTESFLEYEGLDGDPPERSIVYAYNILETRGYHPTHVVVGASTKMFDWLGWSSNPTFRAPDRFMGAKIVHSDKIPDHVFVVCGADDPEAAYGDVKFACKACMPEVE